MNKPIIFMDMDGVVSNFVKGYKDAFQRDAYKDDSFTVESFCRQIPHFFRMLPINERGIELFELLKDDYTIIFLTAPMKGMPFCKRDKVEWIKEHLGNYDVLFSDNKAEYVVDDQSILIDDMSYNLEPWVEAGGTAIRFPDKIDKIFDIIEKTFNPDIKKIEKQLKNLNVNENPTEKQKEAGNYKKSEIINFKDINIKIENPKGSIRFGFDESGKKWISRMKSHYGYIVSSEGADYDPIDCLIGNKLNGSRAFVVNQGKNEAFDEHKIMLGFDTIEEAEKAYLENYQKNWTGLMSIKQTNTKKLRDWLKTGNLKEPF